MAKYVQPTFIVDSSASFLGNVGFDSSVFLKGSTFISSPVTSGTTTPYALVVDSIGSKILVKSFLLGTMAAATAASYDASIVALRSKDANIDTSLNTIWTKFDNDDTSLNSIWTKFGNDDTSLNSIWTKLGSVDISLNGIWTQFGNVNSSLNGLDSSIRTLNTAISNANSSLGLYATNASINTALGYRDTSISGIWTKFGSVDTSLLNLGTKNVNQDTSLNSIWTSINTLATNASVGLAIGPFATNASVGLALYPYATNASVNLQINQLDASIIAINASLNDAIDISILLGPYTTNASIGLAIAPFATNASVGLAIGPFATNASVGIALGPYATNVSVNAAFATNVSVGIALGPYATNASIGTAAFAKNASLSLYVQKAGDTMTGPLSITAGGLSVTNDVSITGGLYVNSDATIKGNLTINGSLNVVNIQSIDVSTSYIKLNTGLKIAPPATLQSGIIVGRGTSDPYVFVYDESQQTFRIGIATLNASQYTDSSTQAVATKEDSPTSFGVPFYNATKYRFDTSVGFIFTPGSGLSIPIATADGTATNSLMLNGSNLVVSRTLGSNAFTSNAYVLQTLFDSSLVVVWNKFGSVDTSLTTLGTKNANQDSSISTLDSLTQVHTAGILDLSTNAIRAVANVGFAGTASVFSYELDNTAYLKKLVQGAGTSIVEDTSTITISVTSVAGYSKKYAGTFDGTAASPFVITAATHGLGTGPIITAVFESNSQVYTGVDLNGSNDVTLTWSSGSLTDASCKFILTG